jgi:hypothetical protein
MRNHHTLVLTDDEYAHVLACLGRVDDPYTFPDSMEFYARLHDKATAEVHRRFQPYYDNMTFSGNRMQKIRRRHAKSLYDSKD